MLFIYQIRLAKNCHLTLLFAHRCNVGLNIGINLFEISWRYQGGQNLPKFVFWRRSKDAKVIGYSTYSRYKFHKKYRSSTPVLAELIGQNGLKFTEIQQNSGEGRFGGVLQPHNYIHLYLTVPSNFIYGRSLLKISGQQHHFTLRQRVKCDKRQLEVTILVCIFLHSD